MLHKLTEIFAEYCREHCIKDACGMDVSDKECQIIFSEAVAELKNDYPKLTVKGLDSIIWNKNQKRQKNCENECKYMA